MKCNMVIILTSPMRIFFQILVQSKQNLVTGVDWGKTAKLVTHYWELGESTHSIGEWCVICDIMVNLCMNYSMKLCSKYELLCIYITLTHSMEEQCNKVFIVFPVYLILTVYGNLSKSANLDKV